VRSTGASLAIGLILGALADAALGDPRRGHPVAGFGRLATVLERRMYGDRRAAGAAYTAACVGGTVALGVAAQWASRRGQARTAVVAVATWAVLGGRSLRREADVIERHLIRDDLDSARARLPHLVGRDPSGLDGSDLARAVVESVAENTADAVVAPLFWGAIAGVPGLVGYRAVNTLDAMVGHRSPRYQRFGWAAARLDDLANLGPARLTSGLVALVSGRPVEVGRVTLRDAANHPSPNAGWCEAAFAGALGVRLGGQNRYQGRREVRPYLGDGRAPDAGDVARARALSAQVSAAAVALAAVAAAWLRKRAR
jgi:adenosylcobinamide-phosphate synthase